MPARTPYSAGHFELAIDGSGSPSYLKSVEGGNVKVSIADASIGNDNMHIKSGVVNEIEPITVEFGMSNGGGILKWIQQSWRKAWTTRNGQITHADFNLSATLEHQFTNALIAETTFPTLDGKSTDAALMKVKFQPQTVLRNQVSGNGYKLKMEGGSKQKSWSASRFRLSIDGHDGFQYTNKIDSFTIKQEITKLYTGVDRYPQLAPSGLTFPNLTGTVSEAKAGPIMQWFNKVTNEGMVENQAQTTGALEYLGPSGQTLMRLNLFEVGILFAGVEASTANSDTIKRVKFELFVGRMDLDADSSIGFDGIVNNSGLGFGANGLGGN